MAISPDDRATIESLITRRAGACPSRLRLQHHVLRGGLEAASIDHVTAHYLDVEGRERPFTVVLKRLTGSAIREAAVYEGLVVPHAGDLAPHLYDVVGTGTDCVTLCLEALTPVSTWPWGERRAAHSVLAAAAALHIRAPDALALAALRAWDYEAALQAAAASTLELLEQLRRQRGLWNFGGALRWTRRVVATLPELRRQLLGFGPFGSAVLHGDLHSGNVVLRDSPEPGVPVLLDWGRARVGSPLEDVSSWLQSLGTWEPEARRGHDTLFVGYLAARGMEARLNADMRAAYWLAGACNALAGALGYHLSVMLDPSVPSEGRASAAGQVREWVRVLRRADVFWG